MRADNFQSNLMSLQDNLLNFAFMLTSNRDDAYDLLQDTTLKALDNQDKFADNTNFKGWVFTIMRNIFINNYRLRFLGFHSGITKLLFRIYTLFCHILFRHILFCYSFLTLFS